MNEKHMNLAIAICLIFIAVSLRLLPHPANFAPVAAVAIFGGAVLPRKLALWAPLTAMVISDVIIGLHPLIFLTWSCYALIALASSAWLKNPKLLNGLSVTLGGSIFFFVATNFGVWLQSGMYARTWSGLGQCYYMAIPFFRNTIASDLFYTAALFAAYKLATSAGGYTLHRMEAKLQNT
jgi:hypothetical protein